MTISSWDYLFPFLLLFAYSAVSEFICQVQFLFLVFLYRIHCIVEGIRSCNFRSAFVKLWPIRLCMLTLNRGCRGMSHSGCSCLWKVDCVPHCCRSRIFLSGEEPKVSRFKSNSNLYQMKQTFYSWVSNGFSLSTAYRFPFTPIYSL